MGSSSVWYRVGLFLMLLLSRPIITASEIPYLIISDRGLIINLQTKESKFEKISFILELHRFGLASRINAIVILFLYDNRIVKFEIFSDVKYYPLL